MNYNEGRCETERSIALAKAKSEVEERNAMLRKSEERFRAISTLSPVGIFRSDPLGRVTYVNEKWLEIADLSLEEAMGTGWHRSLHPESKEKIAVAWDAAVRHCEKYVCEQLYLKKDGTTTTCYVQALPEFDHEGDLVSYIGTVTDISEQKVVEEQLSQAAEETRIALAELASQKLAMDEHAIVAVTDTKGTITYANSKFCEISKYSRDELIGQNHRLLSSGHHPEPFFTDMFKTIANGDTWNGEIRNCAKDGTLYWVDTTITPFKDANGKVIQYVAIRTDITERKRVETLKSEFVSIVSHELRTPLTSLVGSLGLIHSGALGEMPAKAASLLEIAQRNAQRLVALVNDILDIEKIDSGSLEMRFAACDIVKFAEQVLAENDAYGENLGVQFELEAPSGDVFVRADKERLNQVLTNLLSNAAKFSPRGGVVTVKLTRENENIRISVRDCGPGIPPEMQEKIFERFHQVDSSDSRKIKGTGLGLSICKQIAEQHGSEIHLRSTPGEGATFFFCLPEIDNPSLTASELDEELLIRRAQAV
jgi:PAS domain S-box-containing protein